MSRPYDELMEKAECNNYALAEKIYQLGRADQKKENEKYFDALIPLVLESRKFLKELAYKEFAEVIAIDIASCKNCPIDCEEPTIAECEERLVQYVKEMIGEEENEMD